jgi:DNA-binding NarL/FixJ family response regulator
VALIAEGRSDSAIARALDSSAVAVRNHVTGAFRKLGVSLPADDDRRFLTVLRFLHP